MKKLLFLELMVVLVLGAMPALASGPVNYGDIDLSGGFQAGHFDDVWDLTAGDIVISFTYDGNGLVDDFGGNAHAWAELGVRSLGSMSVDFNPYWRYTYWTKTVDLIAGQNYDVGDVVVWGDGQTLYVKYVISVEGCLLAETHLAIADSLD
ncbi:MAG: hypothetical protein OEW09_14715, partial [Anaerolineae bacterium]|nr:hypothetical protein [Anaerolineae bacterium]